MIATGAANYAVSRQGTLIYVPGGVRRATRARSLVWVDRKGHEEPITAPPRGYAYLRVSRPTARASCDRHPRSRTTTSGSGISCEDAEALDLRSRRRWTAALDTRQPADHFHVDALGRAEAVQPGRRRHRRRRPADDERELQCRRRSRRTGTRVFGFETASRPCSFWFAEPCRAHVAHPRGRRAQSPSPAPSPRSPPDGRYLVYQSDESGRIEVYVRPFPQVDGGRWQIRRAAGRARRGRGTAASCSTLMNRIR